MGALRAFPVIYAVADVGRSAEFWQRLGFERVVELPLDGELGYVGLRCGPSEIAIVAWDWPERRYGLRPPAGPCFEMLVYVDDLDLLLIDLSNDGIPVVSAPADTPWGERVATIADPDGNLVSLCQARNENRAAGLLEVLRTEIWPLIPESPPVTKEEREQALGYDQGLQDLLARAAGAPTVRRARALSQEIAERSEELNDRLT